MDTIDETDLVIVPPPEPTHEKGGLLDIFFMSPKLSNQIVRHKIVKSFENISNKISDHFLQIIDLNCLHKTNNLPDISCRWDTNNEWKQKNFKTSVGSMLSDIDWKKIEDPKLLLKVLYKAIIISAAEGIRKN